MQYGPPATDAVGSAPSLLKVTLSMLSLFCKVLVVNSVPSKVNVSP